MLVSSASAISLSLHPSPASEASAFSRMRAFSTWRAGRLPVWIDETSKQLISETRVPIPARPGCPARHDYEYARNGTANLFMMFAPLEGWRHVKVTDHR